MPLPDDSRQPWPPAAHKPLQQDLEEAAAWYSGDPTKLEAVYATGNTASDRKPTIAERARLWSTASGNDQVRRRRVHIPAAADVAATSADLLFGEEPKLTIAEAHAENADSDSKAAEDRLNELIENDGVASTLLEGAEIAAALGGIYLRPAWDPAVADHPMLNTVHADHAVPEFRWGRLVAVTFWRVLVIESAGAVWRHLERHEPGVVLHGLYEGTKDTVGIRRPLDAHPETAGLAAARNEGGSVALPEGIKGLLVRYVPNVLPNRRHRGSPTGRPDTQGCESLMDALDEVWTSWMRDIRIGKARIIVPDEYLDRRGRGTGATFDVDAEVFTPLNIGPSPDGATKAISPVEFKIRTEDHARTAIELFQRIVITAGYSPQSFGMQGDGGDVTATEVRARQGRSFRTTGRKRRYWAQPVEDVAEMMLVIDRVEFGSGVTPMRPRLQFGDVAGTDIRELAQTVAAVRMAEAASIETRVRMMQPDLDGPELKAEVERIKAELGSVVDDPTGGFG